ncbi:hypothetical protein Tsubulata_027504, partial [Turnera subulata]
MTSGQQSTRDYKEFMQLGRLCGLDKLPPHQTPDLEHCMCSPLLISLWLVLNLLHVLFLADMYSLIV